MVDYSSIFKQLFKSYYVFYIYIFIICLIAVTTLSSICGQTVSAFTETFSDAYGAEFFETLFMSFEGAFVSNENAFFDTRTNKKLPMFLISTF